MKLIIDLKRVPCGSKRWRCSFCKELTMSDIYTLSKKSKDGSLFELTMCVDCVIKRVFRKSDIDRLK